MPTRMVRLREKRRCQRVSISLPIQIEYNKEKIPAKTKNISMLGTYLESEKEVPRGTALKVKIGVPEDKKIKCSGIAFRCQPTGSLGSKNQYGIGIFFRSFLGQGEKDLSNYIDCILSQEKKIGKIYIRKRRRKGGK